MKVLFVCNSIFATGNGLSQSARTTIKYLREAGVEVRTLCLEYADPSYEKPDYPLKERHFPIFNELIHSHGYCFAKPDTATIEEALKWPDVIHLVEPFTLEGKVAKMAKKAGVPCVSTYHLHPENLFSSIRLEWSKVINYTCMLLFRKWVWDRCTDINCPTENCMERAQRFHFKANLHYIPNGLTISEKSKEEFQKPQTDPYLVISIGRLSFEKRPETLMRAMKYSKYADKIQLYYAGRGPESEHYMKMAEKMHKNGTIKLKPIFAFHTPEELSALSSKAYLYIHNADVEVEGLSCIESIREGAVPVIADGPLTATSKFALDDRSKYRVHDARDLARKIDYWIEHEDERIAMGPVYARSMGNFDIHKSIEELICMYQKSIDSKKA